MCSVSMVLDDWSRRKMPSIHPWGPSGPYIHVDPVEFARLKAEVEELKEELKKARAKDIEEGATDCSAHKDSVQLVRELAEKLGVDLEDVLDGHK